MKISNNVITPELSHTGGKETVTDLKARDPERLKKACQGVESIFLTMMLKEMRKAIPKSGLFSDSLQKDIYTSLFDQQVAQEAAESGRGIGLSQVLFEQLSGRR